MNALLLVLFILCAASGRNPYKILGVPQSASATKIKKAYRALSRELHPDRNRDDPKAAEKFMDANWAYEVLTNDTLKAAYDRGGEEAVKMVESGRGRPGGGRPFPFAGGGGFFFNGPFGFAGGGPGFPPQFNRHTITRLDWFENTPVELISGTAKLNDITSNWPDAFFLFRKDDDKTEAMAKEYAAVAEAWDQWFNFRAVDCRQPQRIPLCQLAMHSAKPFEVLLAYKGESKPLDVAYSTPQYMPASKLHAWISERAPTIPKTATTQRALPSGGSAPTVLILSADDNDVPLKVRVWANEQKSRASFVLVKGRRLKDQITEVISKVPEAGREGVGLGKWDAIAVLVADPSYIVPENVEWIDLLANSEFVIDWRLTKWIYDKKTGREVFGRARQLMKPLSRETQECGKNDTQWCVIYVGPRGHVLQKAVQEAFAASDLKGASLHLADAASKAIYRTVSQAFGLRAGAPAVVALKGKRNKYVAFQGAPDELRAWFDRLSDTSLLLREGLSLQQPLLF